MQFRLKLMMTTWDDTTWDDTLILLLLRYILNARPELERLALLGDMRNFCVMPSHSVQGSTDYRFVMMWNHPPDLEDFLIKFTNNMERLVFCCIQFYCLDAAFSNKINRLIAEKAVQLRPSLWFHVGNFVPYEDPNLPMIHNREMLDYDYVPPPTL